MLFKIVLIHCTLFRTVCFCCMQHNRHCKSSGTVYPWAFFVITQWFNYVISLFGFFFRYQIKLLNKSISEVLKLANTLNQNTPIFLHTQPWSYKAINLNNKFGFSILKSKTFSNYVNEYNDAVKILKDLYSNETYYNIMKNAI